MKTHRATVAFFLAAVTLWSVHSGIQIFVFDYYESALGKWRTFEYGVFFSVILAALSTCSISLALNMAKRVLSVKLAIAIAILTFTAFTLFYLAIGSGELYRQLWSLGWLLVCVIPALLAVIVSKKASSPGSDG